MPRYYFEADDGSHRANSEMFELNGPDAVREAVLTSLPDMARDIMPNGDRCVMRVTATDEAGCTVYTATLTLDGRWGP